MSRNFLLAALTLLIVQSCAFSAADARGRYTVTRRQNELQSRINRSERSGELTAKEARDLREDLADIRSREAKMRDRNGGKMSYKDISKIEDDLNSVSNKIHKLQLKKRTYR